MKRIKRLPNFEANIKWNKNQIIKLVNEPKRKRKNEQNSNDIYYNYGNNSKMKSV